MPSPRLAKIRPRLARLRRRGSRLRQRGSLQAMSRACWEYAAVQAEVARTELRLERARWDRAQVIVGPFVSEVGFELLYWIPMLRRLLARHGVAPSQVTAISRGGAGPWYRGVADGYVDVLDHFTPDEYAARLARRRAEAGDQKQVTVAGFDREILARVRAGLGSGRVVVVHPSMMVTRFRHYWAGETGTGVLKRHAEFRALEPPAGPLPELPDRFVAVKAYHSSCFPETEANRRFVHDLVGRLVRSNHVVVLPNSFSFDDHQPCDVPGGDRVHPVDGGMRPRDNLEVQTRIVSRADTLFSTYGGFSYLGTLLGVPSRGFYSRANYNPRHQEALDAATAQLDLPALAAVDVGAQA